MNQIIAMRYLLLAFFCLLSYIGNTQNTINLNERYTDHLERNVVNIIDRTNIYVNDGESQELFYYALVPKDSIVGTLVLFPPTWQRAKNVINHNIELVKQAYFKNLLVIIPSINYNLCLDDVSLSFINQSINDVLERYAPPSDKFVVGGFSLGGMNAIRYTEMAYENDAITAIKPAAVYGVDPPLDLARLYHSFLRTIEKNYSQPAMNEAKDYIGKLNHQFGGSPEKFADVYVKYSMYSKSQKDGGNAKYLASVPVRIYCDPDIDWQLSNRRMDYYDMNAVDQTAMINHLLLMGNEEAEFINSLGKGYRLDGRRHPHSWSLVAPKECVEWIMKCLK
jgi:hypothetical protein